MEILVTIASWLFLVGVLMVASSAFPAVTERFPKMLLWGFMVAVASPFVALLGVLLGG